MQFDQLRRRDFITLLGGAAAAWPVVAQSQQPVKLPTIGYLGQSTLAVESQRVAALIQRLRELGWTEGRTVAIEYRWGKDAASARPRLRPSSCGSKSMSLSHPEPHKSSRQGRPHRSSRLYSRRRGTRLAAA